MNLFFNTFLSFLLLSFLTIRPALASSGHGHDGGDFWRD